MAKPSSRKIQPSWYPHLWVAPLAAGACFALGYGITQRILDLHTSLQKPQGKYFALRSFPGQSLEDLRRRYGGSGSTLQADVAAIVQRSTKRHQANKKIRQLPTQEARNRGKLQAAALQMPKTTQQGPDRIITTEMIDNKVSLHSTTGVKIIRSLSRVQLPQGITAIDQPPAPAGANLSEPEPIKEKFSLLQMDSLETFDKPPLAPPVP